MQKLGIFVSATLIFSFALGALALSPEFPVYDVGQRAVIFYEDGVETLVMSSTFAGSADDFAWIIPTPSKPEVDKVSTSLFAELNTRTSRAFKQRGDIYPVPFMVSGLATESFSGPTISVEETKEVGYYEATVVSATDSQELIRWLAERGYTFPSTQGHLLNDYIKDKWHFTIVRIKPDFADSSVTASLRRGHSTPLKLTFNSGEIIYPLKLSKVKIEHNAGDTGVPDYTTGRFGKAVRLKSSDYLKTNLTGFNFNAGGVALWLKGDAPTFSSGYTRDVFRIQNAGYGLADNVTQVGNRLYLQAVSNSVVFHAVLGGVYAGQWTFPGVRWNYNSWNSLVINWQTGSVPELYVNGLRISPSLSSAMNQQGSTRAGIDIFLGSTPSFYETYSSRNFELDEILLNTTPLTQNDINKFTSASPRHSATTRILAHFNDDLSYENAENEQAGTFQLLSSGASKIQPYYDYNYRYGERFPIVIYTIADHRKKLSGFQTEYAGWITKDDIEKLTEQSSGKAWISPKEKKYFLTKLTSNMERSAIDSDLRITDSPNNKTVNAPNPNAIYWFWIIVALSISISGGAVFLLIRILRHPRSGA